LPPTTPSLRFSCRLNLSQARSVTYPGPGNDPPLE
jgi:hypothetical protein